MSIHQRGETTPASPNGGEVRLTEQLEALAAQYGNRFLLEPAPDHQLPEHGMRAVDAMRLIGEELVLDGIPMRNLATFVTTWMEPEAQRVIAENLHRNFIDHAEYPQTAEIEQRCIRMLADLFHAPGETTGARTQGSSEAIMLGALSLKWKWRGRREQAGKDTTRPNLVFGADVHVVWEKFCRYFDVEPRIIPLQKDKYTIGPEDVEPHLDENTIGVAAVLGTTFTGHADDIRGINDLLVAMKNDRGLDVPLHIDAASGGFVWPFLYPDTEWDFRLEQVRSINTSGHKYGLVYPGIGWLVFRETADLAEDLVFYENYLGKRDATFTLNFSTGAAMVLAQYYNFVRLGHEGYRYTMETMQQNSRWLAERIAGSGDFKLVGDEGAEQLPLVAFQLAEERNFDEFDVASQLAAERGWDGAGLHAAPERRARHDHARARQADARSHAGEHARGRSRAGLLDARAEGRPAPARAQAGEDRDRLLSGSCRGLHPIRAMHRQSACVTVVVHPIKGRTMAIGPVQLLVLGFEHPEFHGEIIAELERLRESDTVRVIDALAVHKDADGEIEVAHLSNRSRDEAIELGSKVGALVGLGIEGEEGMEAGAEAGAEAAADGISAFSDDDAWDVIEEIPNDSAAALILLEHHWAVPLRDAIVRAGGYRVSDGFISPLDLVGIGLLTSEEAQEMHAAEARRQTA